MHALSSPHTSRRQPDVLEEPSSTSVSNVELVVLVIDIPSMTPFALLEFIAAVRIFNGFNTHR